MTFMIFLVLVRKHRAPKGALRHDIIDVARVPRRGQKAPSAKRCIKTAAFDGASRDDDRLSESTERQKVH